MKSGLRFQSIVGMFVTLGMITSCFLLGEDAPMKKAVKTTVCRLTSAPDQFENTLVTVRARVESDGMHGSSLIEKSCPGKSVALVFDSSSDEESATAFRKAVFSGFPGTTDKEITGIFTGSFHWHQGQIPNRVLTVKRVSLLRVKKTPAPPPAR